MSFLYFAYGSNLLHAQMSSRCPSARAVAAATLEGWSPVYDKPSRDGSSKLNIRREAGSVVLGVVYDIAAAEMPSLDQAEHLYDPLLVTVSTQEGELLEARTYRWTGEAAQALPYDWYVTMAQTGAALHGLPESYYSNHLSSDTARDPVAPGMRPGSEAELPLMQSILSGGMTKTDGSYTAHPGDLAWWMYHAPPGSAAHTSYWLQGDSGMLEIRDEEKEITAFARPGHPIIPMIEWAQRRLGGQGEVAFVSDRDSTLVSYLEREGYQPVATDCLYEWDLAARPVPEPKLPDGWVLRHVAGENEADNRRAASHAAFGSTMTHEAHLERYLRFMRSPVYDSTRDLVAVTPDGRIVSFMIWWPDSTGIAQIEPFGTHPDFHRRGVGMALVRFGLRRMAKSGMRLARVITNEWREDATGFYAGVGFDEVDRVRWWKPVEGSV